MGAGIIIAGILALLIIGGIFLINGDDLQDTNNVGDTPRETTSGSTSGETHQVEMSSTGFSPQRLEIRVGDRVTFSVVGSGQYWPASNVHPTHEVYPGTSIRKCGNAAEGSIFDACRGLQQGSQFSFVFNEAGTWAYHDHLNPRLTGVIVVR